MRDPKSNPFLPLLLVLSLALLLVPAALDAQGRGRHGGPPFEPPGPPPGVNPPVGHDRSGVPPAHSRSRLLPGSPASAVVTAIQSARSEIEVSLAEGALTAPGGETIQPAAQRQMLGVLTGTPAGGREALTTSLVSGENTGAHAAAEALVTRLDELGESPSSLGEAVASYNAFIEASSEDFLRNPPAQLLALQTSLRTMVDAAFEAARETGASATEQD